MFGSVLHYQGAKVAKFKRIAWLIAFFEKHANYEFDWDQWNETKSEFKHGMTRFQVESVFLDSELLCLGIQINHDFLEDRFGIVGKDHFGNILFISFTFRKGKIRPISSRLANKKERKDYEL